MGRAITPEQIRLVRNKLKLTQTEFSKLLQVSRETIARWENGDQQPHLVFQSAIKGLQQRPRGAKVKAVLLRPKAR